MFGSRARKVGEGQVSLSVAEAVVEERDVLPVQGPRAAQPVEHLLTDVPVGGVGAQGQDGQRRCLKRAVKRRLRERPQLGKALGQRREGKGLGPVSDGAGSRHYGVYRRAFQFIKDPHLHLPFAYRNVSRSFLCPLLRIFRCGRCPRRRFHCGCCRRPSLAFGARCASRWYG